MKMNKKIPIKMKKKRKEKDPLPDKYNTHNPILDK